MGSKMSSMQLEGQFLMSTPDHARKGSGRSGNRRSEAFKVGHFWLPRSAQNESRSMNGLDPPPQSIFLECKQTHADIDIVGYVKNRGSTRWPETAALQFCHGRCDGGCPWLHLAGLYPGEVAQVVLDLRNLTVSGEGADHMVWCIINSDTGEVLDHTQLIEVVIEFTASKADDLLDAEEFIGVISDTPSAHSSFIFPSESGGSDSSWMDCGNSYQSEVTEDGWEVRSLLNDDDIP